MNHLPHAVPEFELAGDDSIGADRHGLEEMADIGVEEGQVHIAGLVFHQDAIGRFGLSGSGRAMLGDAGREGRDLTERSIGDRGARPSVDRGCREMKQQVDHAGAARLVAEQLVERLGRLGADARQRRHRSKQRIENGWAQASSRARADGLCRKLRRFAAERPLTSESADAI